MQKKAIYKYEMFYTFLIILISVLIVWNFYNLYLGHTMSIVSILIQFTMLILLILRHEKTKIIFKIWSILVMVGYALRFISEVLQLLLGDDLNLHTENLILSIVMILLGYIVYAYNERDVSIGYSEKDDKSAL